MLNPTRAVRMNNNQARSAAQPGYAELLDALLKRSWYADTEQGNAGALQRVVNMETLQRLLRLVGSGEIEPQVRAESLDALLALRGWLEQRVSVVPPAWRAHYRFALLQIAQLLDTPGAIEGLRTLEAPPGSPI